MQRTAIDDVVEGEEVDESRVNDDGVWGLIALSGFIVVAIVVIERAAMAMRANLCVLAVCHCILLFQILSGTAVLCDRLLAQLAT